MKPTNTLVSMIVCVAFVALISIMAVECAPTSEKSSPKETKEHLLNNKTIVAQTNSSSTNSSNSKSQELHGVSMNNSSTVKNSTEDDAKTGRLLGYNMGLTVGPQNTPVSPYPYPYPSYPGVPGPYGYAYGYPYYLG